MPPTRSYRHVVVGLACFCVQPRVYCTLVASPQSCQICHALFVAFTFALNGGRHNPESLSCVVKV
jgi:hypothetical protein